MNEIFQDILRGFWATVEKWFSKIGRRVTKSPILFWKRPLASNIYTPVPLQDC
jgi:hypothetical protein